MKIKKIALCTFLVLLLISIYLFSGQTGGKSIHTSDDFTGRIIDRVSALTKKEVTPQRKKQLIYKTRFIVRKAAHFTLYFTLGIIVYLLLTQYNVKGRIIISVIVCFMFACCDEFHQLFVVGRTARFYDCIVDTLGSMTSIMLLYIMGRIKARKREKES